VLDQELEASKLSAAMDEITWRKPRSIVIVIAWSITAASIMLNAFLNGITTIDPFLTQGDTGQWLALLLIFLVSVFAGVLLQDMKAIILGGFETVFLTVLLTYLGIILPIIFGSGGNFYQANTIYVASLGYVFSMFFPLIPMSLIGGVIIGGFVEDLLF